MKTILTESGYILRKNGQWQEYAIGHVTTKGMLAVRAGGMISSPDRLLRVLTIQEVRAILAAQREARRVAEAEKAASEKKAASIEEWSATLPDALDEWTWVDRTNLTLTDQIGNYLTGLRQFYGMTPEQILTRLDEMFGGEGE